MFPRSKRQRRGLALRVLAVLVPFLAPVVLPRTAIHVVLPIALTTPLVLRHVVALYSVCGVSRGPDHTHAVVLGQKPCRDRRPGVMRPENVRCHAELHDHADVRAHPAVPTPSVTLTGKDRLAARVFYSHTLGTSLARHVDGAGRGVVYPVQVLDARARGGVPIAILLVVAYAIAFLTDEPLRGEMTGR